MKTKNYKLYFSFYHTWWDWALSLHISMERFNWDYLELDIHIFCFWFSFTAISKEYLKKLDGITERIKDD